MPRRYPLLVFLSILVAIITAYFCYTAASQSSLPFEVTLVSTRAAAIKPLRDIPLPTNLRVGDQIDLPASPRSARIALLQLILGEIRTPANQSYDFQIRRNETLIKVSVTSISEGSILGDAWVSICESLLAAGMALLLLWRGRDWAAAGMALWVIGFSAGRALNYIPGADALVLGGMQIGATVLYLLARIGFYITIESMLGNVLTAHRRTIFRITFLVVLFTGAVQQLYGVGIFIATGWAEFLRPAYGLIFSTSYLIPVIMLFLTYNSADAAQRLRLRWIMWGSVILLTAIVFSNTPVPFLEFRTTLTLINIGYALALGGFLYAVLRHRVVNVSVFIDRTLVYGSVTALVVGVLAAVNSIVQHAALGTSASVLLQVVVPLTLGIVLGRVRHYADKIVERLLFRNKYLAEKSLRHFARHSGGYDRADALVAATTQIIHKKIGAPGVAVYIRKTEGYTLVSSAGQIKYSVNLPGDDAALAAARSGAREIDLSELHSAFGSDGYVFPMGTQAVLVCANRPGEHYAAEDRRLLAYVAGKAGAAQQTLRIQEKIAWLESKAAMVDALASGMLTASPEIQALARRMATAPAMS